MAKAMIVKPGICLSGGRAAWCAMAACALTALAPAGARAAGATTDKVLGITIPASAKVHNATTTNAATTSVPAATTPNAATTSTSAPTGAAQPGTVAPPTTTPASTATPTASTAAPTAPATTTPSVTSHSTTVVVAHKQKPHATHLSAGALALAILGALLVLGCIVWALGRWLALEPRWTISLTHSLREASYRASETWAEFGDWARLGR
jgi:hypothetical protein